MRKYLLPEEGEFYKANLHCHTKHSDGNLTVPEMRDEYKKRGYSILAVSDHDVLREHYKYSQEDFLILTAYEISIRSDDDPTPHEFRKVVDLNLFAKEPYNTTFIGYHPESVKHWIDVGKLSAEEADGIKYAGELRDMHYYPANINKIIKSANENGFLVAVNHPAWSLVSASEYAGYEGAWAVEVYNHGCKVHSGLHNSEAVYDEILRSGKNIFAIATDDNHNSFPLEHRLSDSFGGFTMIKSERLDYPSVISAMEKGNFYASEGPEIYELYYEDGVVHLECSPCTDISMNTLGRRGINVTGENGELITSADFRLDKDYLFGYDISKNLFGYVRFRITDINGKNAYTNAYYCDELDAEAEKRRAIL